MKKFMFFATVVAMSMVMVMPAQAQSRKEKKAAQKAEWQREQRQKAEEDELRHKLRMDSIANAKRVAEEKAAAEAKARKEAEEKAAAEKRAKEEAEKAEAARQAAIAAQEVDFNEPCMDATSTETTIRARGIGESLKHQTARTKAQTMALRDLAAKVSVAVKSVLRMYTNDESIDVMTDDDVSSGMYNEEKMENMVKQVVNQNLSFSTPCEKTKTYIKGNAKVFKTYMTVQAGKDEILKPLFDEIQKDNRLHLNLGYEKFKEEFEKEFEKAE